MAFWKVDRSYHSTPKGWRLATFEEARNGLETIKEQNFLNNWDRARLLDGWITGPGYDFQMGNDFKGCLGYMLLIQTKASGSVYDEVILSDAGKQVALFLCAEDWNLELVYWLLNSWAKSEAMQIQDVREGDIPFSDVTTFKEMNKMVCSLARNLGDQGPIDKLKAVKSKYSGPQSAKKVIRDRIKFLNEDQNIKEQFGEFFGYGNTCFPCSLEPAWLRGVALEGGEAWKAVADVFWNFLYDNYAQFLVEAFSTYYCLAHIYKENSNCDMKTINTSQKNFISAISILLYLSYNRCNIVHAPIPHGYRDYCAQNIICHAAIEAASPDNLDRFNQILGNNALWRCYENTGNYGLLNKLLVCATRGIDPYILVPDQKADILMINRLIECGGQPVTRIKLTTHKEKGALDYAVKWENEDLGVECVKCLLDRFDGQQREELVNVADEKGRTALHRASSVGNSRICQLLLDCGAALYAQDENGKTAFHFAVEKGKEQVINVFVEDQLIAHCVDLKDKGGHSPLDVLLSSRDTGIGIETVAKLFSKSKQPEAYFKGPPTEIREQLLGELLVKGYVKTVDKLSENVAKLSNALHLAAMCDKDSKAQSMVDIILRKNQEKENVAANRDRRGRTVLHEAALRGNALLCKDLLKINSKIITIKDLDGRNALYEAVKAERCEVDVLKELLSAIPERDNVLDDSIDSNGQTPLHVAASLGKIEVVKALLCNPQVPRNYVKKTDFLGKTALHNAAKYGDLDMVKILLKYGAEPLSERDCDRRTALHYAVQAKTGEDGIELAELLLKGCKTNEDKLLLLWASAAGLGTADRNVSEDDRLHEFLLHEKNEITKTLSTSNLLKTAASVGDIEMTKELITRGYQIGDIDDPEWRNNLESPQQKNVERVSRQLVQLAEQGNDQPTISDNLGRIDYAQGLVALFLNPYIKPPIAVGISGSWGMGKSSLMVKTESILLQTAAQMALLPSSKLPTSALELPDIQTFELSKKGKKKYGEIKRYVGYKVFKKGEIKNSMDHEHKGNRSLFSTMMDKIPSWLKKRKTEEIRKEADEDSLSDFLKDYRVEYRKIFKSLAAMDSSDMFTKRSSKSQEQQNWSSKTIWDMFTKKTRKDQEHQNSHSKTMRERFSRNVQYSKVDYPREENVPAVLTVQYNAWKYRNETEALAGMAVEITKELEGTMTRAQWLSTCCRNTWNKKKYNICIEIIYPCVLAVVLACTFTWILWIILDRYNLQDWAKAKYACLPAAIVIIGGTVTKSVMGILKPVSTQLMNYISFPDHTDKLGYQERVISDITFLKGEIGKKPFMVFNFFSWVLSAIPALWLLITECWVTSLFFHPKFLGNTMAIPNVAPASGTNLRIIVFIDDLDRCQESVILQVLAAINLVLAVCEINVVLGIDKELVERAVIKKYRDMKTNRSFNDNKELADKYLQKIIQLPLDLPDPSEEQSRMFLKGQLGVFQMPSMDCDSEIKADPHMTKTSSQKTSTPVTDVRRSRESTLGDLTRRETASEIIPDQQVAIIDVQPTTEIEMEATRGEAETSLSGRKRGEDPPGGDFRVVQQAENILEKGNSWSWIPIREMLFVRYSQGEQDAFCCFQKMATKSRKLPREWKRLITYHRLVWNILYLTRDAKDLAGWQVQLISWIFICWEWQDNMNFVIENWNSIRVLKTSGSEGPSLQMVVNHFIELETKENEEEEKKESILQDSVSKNTNIETESSNSEKEKLENALKDNMVRENAASTLGKMKKKKEEEEEEEEEVKETLDNAVKEPNADVLDTALRKELDDLKKEMEGLKDLVMKQYSGKIEDEEKNRMKLLNGVKEEVKDLKDQFMKQHKRKNEKKEEEKRMKLQTWKRLRSALSIYNVSMDGILAFQRFRFYCTARHLSWPLPEQENEEP